MVRKCQALVYAPGCWLRDNGRVPEEPRVTWPCRLRHHRAVAPMGPGPSCYLCHRHSRQPWACPFASVSPMVGAENIQIHLPARSRRGEHWHGGPNATTPWQGLTVGGCGPCASAGLSLGGGQSTQHPWQRWPGQLPSGAAPHRPHLPQPPAPPASQFTAYWEALGLQPPGGEVPRDATPLLKRGQGTWPSGFPTSNLWVFLLRKPIRCRH